MTTSEFKTKFVNYCNYLKSKKRLEEEIEELYYRLSGVKAICYDKIPSSFNPSLSEHLKLDLIDKIEMKILEYKSWNTEYDFMKVVVRKLTTKDKRILVRLLLNRETYEAVGMELGYTASGMWKYVENIIESIL